MDLSEKTKLLDHINACKQKISGEEESYTISDLDSVSIFHFILNKNPWADNKDSIAIDQRQKICLQNELVSYFTPEKIENILIPILSQRGMPSSHRSQSPESHKSKCRISLRLLDWFVTNYSKNKSVHFMHPVKKKPINVFSMYKKFLRGYKRTLFDPFRRKAIVCFMWKGRIYNTTVGQLNFLKFCDNYAILDYTMEHHDEIDENMTNALTRSKLIKKITRAKRIKLSTSSSIQIQVNKV